LCEPEPTDEAEGRTSKVPPRLSFALRKRLISRDHRGARIGVEAAHRVVVDGGESRRA